MNAININTFENNSSKEFGNRSVVRESYSNDVLRYYGNMLSLHRDGAIDPAVVMRLARRARHLIEQQIAIPMLPPSAD